MWEVSVGRAGESNGGGNWDNHNCTTIKKGINIMGQFVLKTQ